MKHSRWMIVLFLAHAWRSASRSAAQPAFPPNKHKLRNSRATISKEMEPGVPSLAPTTCP
jgi:hypothetical protein